MSNNTEMEIGKHCECCDAWAEEIKAVIEVAKDNPDGLIDFLQLNFPKEWGLSKEEHWALLDGSSCARPQDDNVEVNQIPVSGGNPDIVIPISEQPVDCREAFEAWAKTRAAKLERVEHPLAGGLYRNGCTQAAWEAWQARALEREVVKLPDDEAVRFLYGEICKSDGIDSDYTTLDAVENAWRALKPLLTGVPVSRDDLVRLMADTESMTGGDFLDALETHGYEIRRRGPDKKGDHPVEWGETKEFNRCDTMKRWRCCEKETLLSERNGLPGQPHRMTTVTLCTARYCRGPWWETKLPQRCLPCPSHSHSKAIGDPNKCGLTFQTKMTLRPPIGKCLIFLRGRRVLKRSTLGTRNDDKSP